MDGELVRDKFHAFDLLKYNGQDVSIEPLHFRLKLLWTLTGDFEQVMTCEDPRVLADLVEMRGGEGIVAKLADGSYTRGGWLKFKKLVTLDFVIVNIDRMKNSAEVSQDGISRGRIMAVPDHVQVGDVVEVAHLEITKYGKIRHGRFVRVHQEKTK